MPTGRADDVLTVDPTQFEVLERVEADLNNPLMANIGFGYTIMHQASANM